MFASIRSLHWTVATLIFIIPILVSTTQSTCTYSCPETDQNGAVLLTSPHAIGYEAEYSIFECIYGTHIDGLLHQHTCNYYKATGQQALGRKGDECPHEAIPCATVDTPKFSAQGVAETPPWVENGKYMIYLKAHPIAG